MEKINLEEADLTDADLSEVNLRGAYGEGAVFTRAVLKGAICDGAALSRAVFADADLRHSNLKNATLAGVTMTGAKLYGFEAELDQLSGIIAEWVDFSVHADGRTKCPGESLTEQYKLMKNGGASHAGSSQASSDQGKRFFGKGDVLRNATLEFGEKSLVEIESRFENCSIAIAAGAVLTLGQHGVLYGCQIVGAGEVVINGEFKENGNGPGIVGPKRLIVGKSGAVSGSVQQPPELTEFGFEHGCRLRLKILK
jgi:uncharacterized protein YjbI with pentapeptide repeats